MRAAILQSSPGTLRVVDVEIAVPERDEVLIRTMAVGLCHSDLHIIDRGNSSNLPVVLGHEAAGIVEAVGPGVAYVKPGDHVVTCPSVFCGLCEWCVHGRPYLCESPAVRGGRPQGEEPRLRFDGGSVHQFSGIGAFAERALVHQNHVVKIRDDMPLDRASLLGCAVTVGLGAVFNTARVKLGDVVAVFGCGGVGLSVVQGAFLAGARQIVAVDLLESKLAMARQLGASDLVNSGTDTVVEQIIEMTKGGVDHAFEAIGLTRTAEQAFASLRPNGTATVIGMIPPGRVVRLLGASLLASRRIQGSSMGSNRFRVDVPRYVDLYLQGRLKLDELVSSHITLDQLNEAFESVRAGEVVRYVLLFDQ